MQTYGNFPLKDGDDIDYKDDEFGVQDEAEVQLAVDCMISCVSKHLSKESKPIFTNIVSEFSNIFCLKLCNDSPVHTQPMNIEFKGTRREIKVRQNAYSP